MEGGILRASPEKSRADQAGREEAGVTLDPENMGKLPRTTG